MAFLQFKLSTLCELFSLFTLNVNYNSTTEVESVLVQLSTRIQESILTPKSYDREVNQTPKIVRNGNTVWRQICLPDAIMPPRDAKLPPESGCKIASLGGRTASMIWTVRC